ncbi:hypothetical protein ACFXNW_02615 [Nocardia sp. NPDC059180]|uniref:hypothetical protein n=1 Tax=Nocardia sp. NPDC059180 TaxID=3346761 RepID=UPI00368DDF31
MGFYDCRCMITGVSLMPVDATLVVLRRVGGNYLPITLGVAGTYDRIGGIDGVHEDLNTELVLRYFLDRSGDGRFFAKDQTSTFEGDALTADSDIEDLIRLIERTHVAIDDENHDGHTYSASTVLDGDMVAFALIAQPVWDAIADAAPVVDRPLDREFEGLFGRESAAAEIYEGRLPELSTALRQLAAVGDVVESHGLCWAPAPEPSQRYPTDYGCQHGDDEVKEFLVRAKRDYQDAAVVSAGLAAYEQSIDWIIDESDEHAADEVTHQSMLSAGLEMLGESAQFATVVYADETDQS